MQKPMPQAPLKSLPATLSVALSLAIGLSVSQPVYAQTSDVEAPVLIHRQLDSGTAGELQTFLARVSDDFGVEQVVLHYRQSDAGQFESISMRPLLDSIGEYMIAVETSLTGYLGMQYYIEAVDGAGNTTNRGFSYAPIVLPLTQPATVTQSPTPGPIVQPPTDAGVTEESGFSVNPTLLLVGLGALVAIGALAAGGSDDAGNDDTVVPTNPGTTPADTVTLTVITDQPSSN